MVGSLEFLQLRVRCRSSLIAILDYGSGNLRSAERAFATSGHDVVVTADRKVALEATGLVIPGVGAFAGFIFTRLPYMEDGNFLVTNVVVLISASTTLVAWLVIKKFVKW